MFPFRAPALPSPFRLACLALSLALAGAGRMRAEVATTDHDFVDHGVAAPISSLRSLVATVDGEGKNVAVACLMDHRGGYALLTIDAATGRTKQFPLPFAFAGDTAYASLLSSRNKFYTLFAGHFVEFDVAKGAFTFDRATTPRCAMGMTEDDRGVIWAVIYPQSAVVSFDPQTREFHDYGNVYPQKWAQYQRFVAADDTGWIYFGLGQAESQIIAFDPATGKATPMLADRERRKGTAYVYRDLDGKVYGQALRGEKETWIELHRGKRRQLDASAPLRPKPIVTGDQGLFHAQFPNGDRIVACDPVDRKITVAAKGRNDTSTTLPFDYTSEGAQIMDVAMTPNGAIAGGTMFPFRFFSFTPKDNAWDRRPAWYQWNTQAAQGGRHFVGGYPKGFLLEWDPAQPWSNTEKNQAHSNPVYLTDCSPVINRPARLLAHPDGRTIIMGGGPEYGYTGGGLLFWDRIAQQRTLLTDREVVPDQSTLSLIALTDGQLLGGTTTAPGTGGEQKATTAELYLMDFATKKTTWHAAVLPGVQQYTDLSPGPAGVVFGIADRKIFFVFDPHTKAVVYQKDVSGDLGLSAFEQGPRVFVPDAKGKIYALFQKGVATINPASFELKLIAPTPVPVEAGGAYLNGRIYFTNGSHLCSVAVP